MCSRGWGGDPWQPGVLTLRPRQRLPPAAGQGLAVRRGGSWEGDAVRMQCVGQWSCAASDGRQTDRQRPREAVQAA